MKQNREPRNRSTQVGNLNFDKCAKAIQGEKVAFTTNFAGAI